MYHFYYNMGYFVCLESRTVSSNLRSIPDETVNLRDRKSIQNMHGYKWTLMKQEIEQDHSCASNYHNPCHEPHYTVEAIPFQIINADKISKTSNSEVGFCSVKGLPVPPLLCK